MSVRVVARLRPLWKTERDLDIIVHTASSSSHPIGKGSSNPNLALRDRDNIVKIPNHKNDTEQYAFQFNAVYDGSTTQQEIFDAEVAPTVKHLFNGFDVTIFAYGVTGTGKTHTMRGGKSLADRGVIPRLLSGIYRRSRKIEKDSGENTKVEVSMSYYEIYNDKVYDLFEPSEKRTAAGLPLRDNGGKTVVVGLTERPCRTLKEFEALYDQANVNRSTSATKLNAHSSRSHAILCVKVTLVTGEKTRTSVASAIDLAGSEDNRRTENGKERMVESASINKSLFVLAQCVEAISKKQPRIPYRESKMTRILSLGQNNGLTIMILNLAPVRSYHLDTLSSLNFANRTKKIEVRDVENEPIFRGPTKLVTKPLFSSSIRRQPLRPLSSSVNVAVALTEPDKSDEKKPAKAFLVYSDKLPVKNHHAFQNNSEARKHPSPLKHASDVTGKLAPPIKTRHNAQDTIFTSKLDDHIYAAKLEELVEKKVEAILAARASLESAKQKSHINEMNEQMQRRIEQLEKRVEGTEDTRAEGLSLLLMAKQHQARGERLSALKMYKLALPFFPKNEKLLSKISKLESGLNVDLYPAETKEIMRTFEAPGTVAREPHEQPATTKCVESHTDEIHQELASDCWSDSSMERPQKKRKRRSRQSRGSLIGDTRLGVFSAQPEPISPRSSYLLAVINSRDINQIKLLKGVGVKKAEAIVDCLCELDHRVDNYDQTVNEAHGSYAVITNLLELEQLKGVGPRTLQNMRNGVVV